MYVTVYSSVESVVTLKKVCSVYLSTINNLLPFPYQSPLMGTSAILQD